MARKPKPWFRKAEKAWFVTLNGRQINLGRNKKEAEKLFYQLMAAPEKRAVPQGSVLEIIDAFLDHLVNSGKAKDTYEWYRWRLEKFARTISPVLSADQLRPHHVQTWVDSVPTWGDGSKRNAIRSIKTCMKWAEEQGYIDRSPIAFMKKPKGGKRETVLTSKEYSALVEHITDDAFRDLVVFTWETGARPQEGRKIEPRHVELEHSRIVFPVVESKTDIQRVIYLNDAALEIVRRRIFNKPCLFLNADGNSWTKDAINCRFCRLQKTLGKKYNLYVLRHSWINRLLLSGVDALSVALLAGHVDPSTISTTYQHLAQRPDFLLEQLRRA